MKVLIVVDMQNDFITGSLGSKLAENIVEKVVSKVKAFDGTVHEKCTGQDNTVILENLRYLDEKGCKIEIRIPYVPHWNAGEAENIATILSNMRNITKIRVLPYHNYAGAKYDALDIKNTLPTVLPNEDEMNSARETVRKMVGNHLIIE